MTDVAERLSLDWLDGQVTALRALDARLAGPSGVDIAGLVELLEGMLRSEKYAASSQLLRALEHLLKLAHARDERPRNGWRRSVRDARAELELMRRSQRGLSERNLRRHLEEELRPVWQLAKRKAAAGLLDHGDDAGAHAVERAAGPWGLDDVLDLDWFPPNHPG